MSAERDPIELIHEMRSVIYDAVLANRVSNQQLNEIEQVLEAAIADIDSYRSEAPHDR